MKYFFAIAVAAMVYGCGGGSGGGADLQANPVVLNAGNETVRLDRTDRYSLSITSSGNRVTFGGASRVDALLVDGTGNTVRLESGATATTMDIAGANNNVSLADHVTVPTLRVSGANAVLDIGAADSVNLLSITGSNATVRVVDGTAAVTRIDLAVSNILLTVPAGFAARTTINTTGANNRVVEQ